MNRAGAALVALLLAACRDRGPALDAPVVTTLPNGTVEIANRGPSGWADTTGWKLVELYRVGGADAEGLGAEELVGPWSVALDAAGGIFVADQKPAVIKQFGPDGRYLRSFGREGGGPGEFQVAFIAAAPGALVVHDPQTARTSVFDSAGNFVRSWPSSCCYWSGISVSRDTVIHVQTGSVRPSESVPSERLYLRYRMDGTLIDTMHVLAESGEEPKVWRLSGGSGGEKWAMATGVPLAARVSVALEPSGGAVVGWSGRYEFLTTGTGRDTLQIVSLAATPVTVSEARRIEIRDSILSQFEQNYDPQIVRDAFKLTDIPSTAPLFESIQVDGHQNRWVFRDDGADRAAARFDVFDSTGTYLGAVPVPGIFGSASQTVWGMDRVATIAEDAEGLPVVVVYGIDRR